jgi:leucyl aminopeptidase
MAWARSRSGAVVADSHNPRGHERSIMEGLKVALIPLSTPAQSLLKGVVLVFCDDKLGFGPATRKLLGATTALVERAAAANGFKGKKGTALDLVAPAGLDVVRLVVAGCGKVSDMKAENDVQLGGAAFGKVPSAAVHATIIAELPNGALKPERAADLGLGAMLRAYRFERYKTKRQDDDKPRSVNLTIAVADLSKTQKAWHEKFGIADGVILARDLVNEPANVLYPEEFARRADALKKLGVAVEVLDVAAMKKLGMNALLGVGQGSMRESRVVVMRWNGGRKTEKPIAFVGKGVCFDTGGISIKPAASMEDMKGDMGGAAAVVGLMHALATRKARANVIGAIGLVENMPDGRAQRPGDIVKSMSGQTIEVINTDAEGRLVLCDVLHYVNTKFEPQFIVDLATLTGAIMVALAQEYAGLFSNNDKLADRLTAAGEATGERVWRLPLGTAYDKMIDSKFADMKNTGGRFGGSITAAQFLQRFVGKTPWAHLDIAGTAMGSLQSDINKSWGSGWGVRLLNRFVADHYER